MNASGVVAGQTTDTLEIQTNAVNFMSGTVSVQDGSSGFNTGFAPTAVPEPAYMGLVGAGLLVIGSFGSKKRDSRR